MKTSSVVVFWAKSQIPLEGGYSYVALEPGKSSASGLIKEILQTLKLQPASDDLFRVEYRSFDEVGAYYIVIYSEDNEGLLARPKMLKLVVGNMHYLPMITR